MKRWCSGCAVCRRARTLSTAQKRTKDTAALFALHHSLIIIIDEHARPAETGVRWKVWRWCEKETRRMRLSEKGRRGCTRESGDRDRPLPAHPPLPLNTPSPGPCKSNLFSNRSLDFGRNFSYHLVSLVIHPVWSESHRLFEHMKRKRCIRVPPLASARPKTLLFAPFWGRTTMRRDCSFGCRV